MQTCCVQQWTTCLLSSRSGLPTLSSVGHSNRPLLRAPLFLAPPQRSVGTAAAKKGFPTVTVYGPRLRQGRQPNTPLPNWAQSDGSAAHRPKTDGYDKQTFSRAGEEKENKGAPQSMPNRESVRRKKARTQ